jgi:cell division protein FtsW (lipid II flippase)
VLLALLLVMVASAPYFVRRGVDDLRSAWPTPITDFPVFYHAGALAVSEDRHALYNRDRGAEVDRQNRRAVGNFYSPPGLALVYAPLTLLDRDSARVVFLALSVGAAAGLAGLSFLWRREFAFVALSVLAVASLLILYDVLYLGHPSLCSPWHPGRPCSSWRAEERWLAVLSPRCSALSHRWRSIPCSTS